MIVPTKIQYRSLKKGLASDLYQTYLGNITIGNVV